MDSTLTAVDSVIVEVSATAAFITADGEDTGIEAVWCSPTPKKSRPACSASLICSSMLRTACAVVTVSPSGRFPATPKL